MPLPDESRTNGLWIVGIGPGRMEYMTGRAIDAISGADYVIGNDSYLEPLESLLAGKQVMRSSMGKEIERAKKAIELCTVPQGCDRLRGRCRCLRHGRYRP